MKTAGSRDAYCCSRGLKVERRARRADEVTAPSFTSRLSWTVVRDPVILVAGMAYYLVRAKPKPERLPELHARLGENAFINLRPFGEALTHSLKEARTQPDGTAVWEEEDYCSPPLAEERAAVLDTYFDEIKLEQVNAGEGWKRIEALPKLNDRR